MAKAQDITFENVNIEVSNQPNLVQIYHKVENLKVINCNLRNISECIEFNIFSSGSYPTDNKVSILLSGNYYDFIGNKYLYTVNGSNFSGRMKICSSMVKEGNLVKKNDPNNSITLLDDDVF